jgi:hypothetical protein
MKKKFKKFYFKLLRKIVAKKRKRKLFFNDPFIYD